MGRQANQLHISVLQLNDKRLIYNPKYSDYESMCKNKEKEIKKKHRPSQLGPQEQQKQQLHKHQYHKQESLLHSTIKVSLHINSKWEKHKYKRRHH